MHIGLEVIPFSKQPYWEGKRTSIKPFVTCGVEERKDIPVLNKKRPANPIRIHRSLETRDELSKFV
jgi:hypothetical protein